MALPTTPEEREQGAVQEQEVLEAAAPPPLEETPTQADERVLKQAQAPAPSPQQDSVNIRNPYMLLPRNVLFRDVGTMAPRKTTAEQNYDVGMLWRVLADSPSSDSIVKTIAKRLIGGE